jgi:hypothetical protein
MSKSLIEQAEERVVKFSPAPKHQPVDAGVGGVFVTGMVLAPFLGFSGIEAESVAGAFITTVALGFACPYLFFRSAWKKHHQKVMAEYRQLKDKKDANHAFLNGKKNA